MDIAICEACGAPLVRAGAACGSCTTMPAAADVPSATEAFTIPGFRILEQLGAGGMGVVYAAEDLALERCVAVKLIAAQLESDPSFHERFIREAKLMATAEDPNVVRVYAFGESAGRRYLVMEYVDGQSLAQRLRIVRRFPLDEALRIVLQVAFGLRSAAARGIVHRDVKPSNILIDQRENVRVTDFGLSLAVNREGPERSTHPGHFIGTPHYVAPEQAEGLDVGIQADMYALGIVLFELLTGQPPFVSSTPISIIAKHLHEELPRIKHWRRDATASVQRLIDHLTRKDPGERPRSWDAAIDEIRSVMKPFAAPVSAKDYLSMPLGPAAALIGLPAAIVFGAGLVLLFFLFVFVLDLGLRLVLPPERINYFLFWLIMLAALEAVIAGVYYFWTRPRRRLR